MRYRYLELCTRCLLRLLFCRLTAVKPVNRVTCKRGDGKEKQGDQLDDIRINTPILKSVFIIMKTNKKINR